LPESIQALEAAKMIRIEDYEKISAVKNFTIRGSGGSRRLIHPGEPSF
jgi:hypothetical protein